MKSVATHSLLAVLLFAACTTANGQGLVVYKKDGTAIKIPYAEFDRIDTYGYGEAPETGGSHEEIANKTFTVGEITFTMIAVKAGTFQMGSTNGDADERPIHTVTLSKDYYIGETEVTQALWKAVTGFSPTKDGDPWLNFNGSGSNYPAYNINYQDVQSFIALLNQRTGQSFRMPTEAEWEYAAKGGNKSQGYTYSGRDIVGDVAWYDGNSDNKTHPVKTKSANELGIYDMSGNVWEWCADGYSDTYYSVSPSVDPAGPDTGASIVVRGGSFCYEGAYCRTTDRTKTSPTTRRSYYGFRLALSAE